MQINMWILYRPVPQSNINIVIKPENLVFLVEISSFILIVHYTDLSIKNSYFDMKFFVLALKYETRVFQMKLSF